MKKSPIRDRIKELCRVRAGDLSPCPRNWRVHGPAQINALRGVLSEIGYADALLARELQDGTLELVDGHARQALDPEQVVPVLVLDLDQDEALKLMTVLDPLAGLAEANEKALESLLAEIQTDSEAVQTMLDGLAAEHGIALEEIPAVDAEPQIDRAAELQKEWMIEAGQIWEVVGKAGTHRVMCGDSTKAEDVGRLMGGTKAFLMATDPPYGVDFVGAKYNPRAKDWAGIANDKRTGDELRKWLAGCFRIWLEHCRDDVAVYCWTAAMEEGAAAAAVRDVGLHIQSQIIWVKNCLVLGQADYQWRHENCWYAFKKGKKHKWNGGRSQTTVWECNKLANSAYQHPMQKPTELYARSIENHTCAGDVVCDPFLGSGTQVIAAEQLGRVCYGCEISPAYVAVCLQRAKDVGVEPRLTEA